MADREKRIKRIMKRDNISEEYAASRVDAQKPNEYFEKKCSITLENNGVENEFKIKCYNLFKELTEK